MFQINAPVVLVPTAEARRVLGRYLRWAGLAAWREIAVAGQGLEIEHLQLVFFKQTLAVCSRVRDDGFVEIKIGLGNPRLPTCSFTAKRLREALATARSRIRAIHYDRSAPAG